MSPPPGIMGVFELSSNTSMIPDDPDDERKYRSKHVEQPRNNKLPYTVASCWSFSNIRNGIYFELKE